MKTHPDEGDESDFTSNSFEDESPSEGIKAVAPEENTSPGWPPPPPTNDNLEATVPPYNKVYPPPPLPEDTRIPTHIKLKTACLSSYFQSFF